MGVRIFLGCGNIWVYVCMNGSPYEFISVLLLRLNLFFCLRLVLIWAPIKIICIIFILFCFIFTFHSVCAYNSSISLVSFKKVSFRSRWPSHLLMFWRRFRLCNYSSASIFPFSYFFFKKLLESFRFFNNWNIIYS